MSRAKSKLVSTLILGGGLAGLSTAYHSKKSWLLVEREGAVGGTARSFKVGKFTFDFTGHLLHLHTPATKKLIRRLLKGRFYSCVRNAWIFSHDAYTRYPFQASTKGLPDNVVSDCVLGFLEAYLNANGKSPRRDQNFFDWSNQTFGKGISKHFMIPYNEKLFQVSTKRMSTDWCGPFVPMPKLDEVIRGATADHDKSFGYNTTFLYPKKGGIQALANALAKNLKGIRLKTTVAALDWRKRQAVLSTGESVRYQNMVNSIPLTEFLKLLSPMPAAVRSAAAELRYASILCLNIGVKRARISDKSWIYFPEKQFPFYRVGFPMNFTPHVVPRGCSSMYVEVPWTYVKGKSQKRILSDVRAGLIRAGILKRSDKLPVVQFLPIRHAYVIYNRQRQRALKTIFSFLTRNRIQSIGRYGAWKYSFMEEAILDGMKAARAV